MATCGGLSPALNAIITKIEEQSGGKVTCSSGGRSYAEQAALYDAYLNGNGNLAAKPGSSRHEGGLAADLTGDIGLARKLAAKYGLVIPDFNESYGGGHLHVELAGASPGAAAGAAMNEGAETTTTEPADLGAAVREAMLRPPSEVAGIESQTPEIPEATSSPASGFDEGEIPAGAEGIDAFMARIRSKESGGNYQVVNSDSGAAGAYQFMPGTWKGAGGSTSSAHLASPEEQDRIARKLMLDYYRQFGNWRDVAIAWYAGPGSVASMRNSYSKQGAYPSVAGYADAIVAGL